MIKPTLGRVVWFTPEVGSPIPTEDDGRCAAIVTKVWGDNLVNLAVFDANGQYHAKTSVALLQDGDAPLLAGYFCEWMPYQKGQAAKTEALEKAAELTACPGEKSIGSV